MNQDHDAFCKEVSKKQGDEIDCQELNGLMWGIIIFTFICDLFQVRWMKLMFDNRYGG